VHDDSPPSVPDGGLGDLSDAELTSRARAGDGSAFGELWRRHARAGRTVARSFTSSLDPDDLVQESFAKIFQALQKGGGPTGAFRPYLFTTIRNTASAWGRARRETSLDTLESLEDPASRDEETMAALDRSLTATAFRSMPSRWQEVLWYCEVEQMTPQQVAPLLGMKPNAVAALAYRAREGLRQAWIQAHIASVPEGSEHRWTIERIGSYTRGALGKRDTTKLEAHLDECARCTIVAAEAREVGSRIALVLLPLAAGTVGASGYLAWVQSGSHTAVAAAVMPASVLGGHGMGLAAPADPATLASLSSSTAASTAAGSTGPTGSSAAVTTSGGLSSIGTLASGVVASAVAIVAAGAVAAALVLSPSNGSPATPGASSGIAADAPAVGREPSPLSPSAPSPTTAPSPNPSVPATTAPPVIPSTPTPAAPPLPAPSTASPPEPTPPAEGEDPTEPGEPQLPSAPVVSLVDGGPSSQFFPIVSGTAEPGALVTLRRGGAVLAQVTSDATGSWQSPPLIALPAGWSELSITQATASAASASTRTASSNAAPSNAAPSNPAPSNPGSSNAAIARVFVRSAPTITDPTDGAVVYLPRDTTLTLAPGVPSGVVAGAIDGAASFTCVFDARGLTAACTGNTGVDWSSFAPGRHTVTVAYSDGHGRFGPPSSIDVIVARVLPGDGNPPDRAEETDTTVAHEVAAQPALTEPGPAASSTAETDRAEISAAQPNPAQRNPAQPNPAQPNPAQPSPAELPHGEPTTPEPTSSEPGIAEPTVAATTD
jgi:RNA polymerase sigma factor (sigma-70 family)